MMHIVEYDNLGDQGSGDGMKEAETIWLEISYCQGLSF